MKMHIVPRFVTLTVLLLLSVISGMAKETPNIIIILADDLGIGDVGCFGSDKYKTPNIDKIGAEGVRFTDFHANASVCSPTRVALLTGRYQQRSGIIGVLGPDKPGLQPEEVTFAEVLKDAGYATALFGKWHVGTFDESHPVNQGFDEYKGFLTGNVDYKIHISQYGDPDWWHQQEAASEEGYLTDLITNHSIDFINHHKDQPFLMFVSHGAPHCPIMGRDDDPVYKPGKGKFEDRRHFNITPDVVSDYKEMIEVMDEGIGKIMTALEENGIRDNTFILFTSDNGPSVMGTAGPYRGAKGSLFEGGTRVPTVASWPAKIPAGQVSDEICMTADILPTIAEMAGATTSADHKIDGVSLMTHMIEGTPLDQRAIFWGNQAARNMVMRKGDYKLFGQDYGNKFKLYNLAEDVGETKDIAKNHPELVEGMKKEMFAWAEEVYYPLAERRAKAQAEKKEKEERKKAAKRQKQKEREQPQTKDGKPAAQKKKPQTMTAEERAAKQKAKELNRKAKEQKRKEKAAKQ